MTFGPIPQDVKLNLRRPPAHSRNRLAITYRGTDVLTPAHSDLHLWHPVPVRARAGHVISLRNKLHHGRIQPAKAMIGSEGSAERRVENRLCGAMSVFTGKSAPSSNWAKALFVINWSNAANGSNCVVPAPRWKNKPSTKVVLDIES